MKTIKENLQDYLLRGETLEFQQAFQNLKSQDINEAIAELLTQIYQQAKDTFTKNRCLKLLYDKDYSFLKDFFQAAYSKSRYLDMKLHALRGLAQFEPEAVLETLLVKFNATLKKRPQTTPYNYQEYELLRGRHALPFLVQKYGYKCFKETLEIVETQYQSMPDAFKGHFTTDEAVHILQLRAPGEANRMMQEFFQALH